MQSIQQLSGAAIVHAEPVIQKQGDVLVIQTASKMHTHSATTGYRPSAPNPYRLALLGSWQPAGLFYTLTTAEHIINTAGQSTQYAAPTAMMGTQLCGLQGDLGWWLKSQHATQTHGTCCGGQHRRGGWLKSQHNTQTHRTCCGGPHQQ